MRALTILSVFLSNSVDNDEIANETFFHVKLNQDCFEGASSLLIKKSFEFVSAIFTSHYVGKNASINVLK